MFSYDDRWIARVNDRNGDVHLWRISDGYHRILSAGTKGPPQWVSTKLAFSPDGKWLASFAPDDAIVIWDWNAGAVSARLKQEDTPQVKAISFTADSRFLACGSADGAVRLWNVDQRRMVGALVTLRESADWLVVTPEGLFDGTPNAWSKILWRFNNDSFDVASVEAFFSEYFHPGLLAELLDGQQPTPAASIAQKDRRQPEIQLSVESQGGSEAAINSRQANITVALAEAPTDKDHVKGSGARDVRLFRDGSLVKMWHGDVLAGRNSAELRASVSLVAGENRFTAYDFNDDNIKSTDATLTVIGSDALRRTGTAYILTVGLNGYANKGFDLRYAVADAQIFSHELETEQENLGKYDRVESIALLDEKGTRANILAALARFAGKGDQSADTAPELAKLKTAQPEDAVFIFFAGHGMADAPRFYLIPYDLGYTGTRDAIDEAGMKTIEAHSISDEDLDKAFESIDAGHIVLVIDACNSGQALEADEKRRGPMNSKGLAQLAYEKGMYILTAAQGFQQAQEVSQFGHGLLTYALVQERLVQNRAAKSTNEIPVRDWLDYAVREVPQLQEKWVADDLKLANLKSPWLKDIPKRGFNNAGGGVLHHIDPSQVGLQTPRAFYRRESEREPFVIAHKVKSGS